MVHHWEFYMQTGRGGAGWGNTRTRPEPAPGFKKNHIPVPNPFIKFKPRPIRGGAGRVPEKTRPVAIPRLNTIKILQPQTSERHQIFWSENLSFIVIGPVWWHVTLLIHHNRTIITLKSPQSSSIYPDFYFLQYLKSLSFQVHINNL